MADNEKSQAEVERESRLDYVNSLRASNPTEYFRISSAERLSATRHQQAKTGRVESPEVLPPKPCDVFDSIIELRAKSAQQFQDAINKLSPHNRLAFGRYWSAIEASKAAGQTKAPEKPAAQPSQNQSFYAKLMELENENEELFEQLFSALSNQDKSDFFKFKLNNKD